MTDLDRLADLLAAHGPRIELRSPLDGTALALVPTSDQADVAAAAARARLAQGGWSARPIDERAQVLLRFHDRLLDERDRFADLVQREAGKSRLTAMEEVLHVALTARYYGRTARRYLGGERGFGVVPGLTRIDRRCVAKGLVGVIGPWNYPMAM